MPNIINNNEISPRHKVYYQQFDHEIAAFTLIYNRALEHDRKLLKENVYLNLVKRKDYLLCQSLIQLDYFCWWR